MPVKSAMRVLGGTILAVTLAFSWGCATTGEGPGESEYPRAPEISFPHMEGDTTTLSDYADNSVLVINFWGLRCQNCIEEMPFLERLHNKYGSKGLVILGVNTDGVDGPLLKKFLPQLPVKVSYPIIVDPEFVLADGYEMMAAPLTVLIAKDSTIRFRHEGYEPEIEKEYVEIIERLLAE